MINILCRHKGNLLVFIGLLVLGCIGMKMRTHSTNGNGYEPTSEADKIKGVHVFGRLDSNNIQPIIETNFNWITLVPYANQEDIDSERLSYQDIDSSRHVARNTRVKEWIHTAHQNGLKVLVKPHIWLFSPRDGKWRSDLYPITEEKWKLWKNDYRAFILRYAKLAEESGAEMFCIGAELTRLTTEKPEFWSEIIREVRKVYNGKLTYAANWYKEYENIKFWEELDYIGVQAYFPLTDKKPPSVSDITKGWEKHSKQLEKLAKKYKRPILFTELGYKSTHDSAEKPWEWINYENDHTEILSYETQSNCYQAFFEAIWQKEWMAGVHIWQWRSNPGRRRGKRDLDFTPQEKPAQEVIKNGFKN